MQLNTLFQMVAMREMKSSLLDIADTLLFMPDLFNYLFTGVKKAEYSIASTSQMLDARTGKWADAMLKQLDIPTHFLPEIVPCGTQLGPVQESVRKELKVGEIPVIATAGHDTAAAVASVPAEGGDEWCYISSGTWSLMGVEIPKPILNEKALQLNYTNEGGVGGTIRFLKNIMGLWLVQECRRQFVKDGHEYNYAELTEMAARSTPLRSLIDPDDEPFGKPGEMPAKIEAFCKRTNQAVPSSRGEFVRCCLDSLALTYRRTLEGLESVLGKKIKVIHIVGGGTQNELLNQMTADACGRPVIAGPVEATSIGNILVQAMATGDVASLADARAIVRNSFEVKRYQPIDTAKWDEAYGKFRHLK
jgi:rhamnulokinase